MTNDIPWKSFGKKEFLSALLSKQINSIAAHKNGYFFIKGRDELVLIRKKRAELSKKKIIKAKKIIKKLSIIPSVKFAGISGALSMENSEKSDDIDLFIITEKNLLWSTRFFLILFLKYMGVYRSKNDNNYSDKICLNMLLDEKNIAFRGKDRNLYTAHEILQVIPVIDKDGIYNKFMEENKWIKKIMPNATPKKIERQNSNNFTAGIFIFLVKIFFLEKLLQYIQYEYMKKNITKEKIKNGILGFHPFDYGGYAIDMYIKNLRKFGMKQ